MARSAPLREGQFVGEKERSRLRQFGTFARIERAKAGNFARAFTKNDLERSASQAVSFVANA